MNPAVDRQGLLSLNMGLDGDGHIAMNSYEDHVRQSILLIAQTAQGERMMRPDFGSGLSRMVFEPLGQATISLVQHTLTQALTRYEPRIDIVDLTVISDPSQPGLLQIRLDYQVRRTDAIYNLVFPFFLQHGGL